MCDPGRVECRIGAAPMATPYPALFEPIAIGHLRLKNRIMSTSHAPAYAEDGMPKERYRRYHEEKAKGGLALSMFGGSSTVSVDSPPPFGQIDLGDDRVVPWMQAFADGVHRHGCATMIQITHMGRRTGRENRRLRMEIETLKTRLAAPEETRPQAAASESGSAAAGFVRVDPKLGYEILDPTTNINRRQRLILERRKDGTLAPSGVHVQGAVTAIANYQSSNRDDRFGYLMRHPTSANQVGDTVSEATIHSVQFGLTGLLGDWVTANAEFLLHPPCP